MTKRVAPGSRPRVGCSATSTAGRLPSSRASTIFCWLPPDSVRAAVPGPGARIPNSAMRSRASFSIAPASSHGPRRSGGSSNARSARFSAMVMSATRPVVPRSAGTCARPAARRAATPPSVTSAPSTKTAPRVGRCIPATISASSAWPLPSTPTRASTSPALTEKLTPRKRSMPSASTAVRSATTRRSGPTARALRSIGAPTSRPTIMCARSRRLIPATSARPATSPSRRTTTSSQTSSTSPSLCEMKITERPSSRRRRRTPRSPAISGGLRLEVGSSRTRSRAPRRMAFTISTRCRAPSGSDSTRASGSRSRP